MKVRITGIEGRRGRIEGIEWIATGQVVDMTTTKLTTRVRLVLQDQYVQHVRNALINQHAAYDLDDVQPNEVLEASIE